MTGVETREGEDLQKILCETVLFDLDGTITDSAPGILDSIEYALTQYGCGSYKRADLYRFVGPPLIESFMSFIPCSREDAEKCLVWYREFYTREGMFRNVVYPGVVETLSALRARGVKIALATAKPEVYARRILDHFELTPLFDGIYGATLEEGRNRKDQVVAWALSHLPDPSRVIMVGDRADDVKGAAANGLSCIGALWGYGGEQELRAAGALRLATSMNDLLAFL